ncbi:MAG: N-acetyltransferase [Bacteroidota bacterium]
MDIQTLAHTDISTLVNTLTKAFKGYFVEMPNDVAYWDHRFKASRVNYDLSTGVFDQDRLVAFIVNAVDNVNGEMTAHNTGTGVIPHYRGQKWVDKMYDFILPIFQEKGIQTCSLEVIDQNERAIRVYKRIGFEIRKRIVCYKGRIQTHSHMKPYLEPFPLEKLPALAGDPSMYSWDNTLTTVLRAKDKYKGYQVWDNEKKETYIGHFVMQSPTGYIPQLEALDEDWEAMLQAISQINYFISINNIDERRTGLIKVLQQHKLMNTINQYEMEMSI